MSLKQRIILGLLSPVSMIVAGYHSLPKMDRNPFKKNKTLDGKKLAAISDPINVDEVKNKSKELGCSLNDIIMLAFSLSFREYFI